MTDTTHAGGAIAGNGPDSAPEKPSRVGHRKMILGVVAAVGASVGGSDPTGAGSPDAAKDLVLSKVVNH
jgi:hypothetical protein